jgi:hypothetical protein
MKRSLGIVVSALLLAIAGGICLFAGLFERRMGVAQEDMAVLDFEDPQADYAVLQQDLEKLPWLSLSTLQEIKVRRATLQYWQHDYGDLAELAVKPAHGDEAVDPELQLLGANAAFRMAQRGPQDKVTVLKNLDAAIRAYAEALRAGNERPDAAFNYELTVRIREELASGKRKGMPAYDIDEDKSDANMHGDPGEPPKDMKVEQFQIRIPMDPKDFKSKEDTSAGRGQVRKRRG